MWGAFIVTCLMGVLVIFLPGFLMLRTLRFSLTECVVYAPPLSITVITLAGVICHALGGNGILPLIVGSLILTALFCGCALCFMRFGGHAERLGRLPSSNGEGALSWKLIVLYASVNVVMMTYLYLICIGSPDAVISFGDNDYHIAVVKGMMDGGNFSTLNVSAYPDSLSSSEIPLRNEGYYPAGWHVVTALMGTLADATAMTSENASLFLFTAIVFPFGVLALLHCAFPKNRAVVFWGAFAVTACVAFPLRPLLIHQIYPNVAGFACIPGVVALFYLVVKPYATNRLRSLAAFCIGFVGLALLHPSSVFACGVFLYALIGLVALPQLAAILERRRNGRMTRTAWNVALFVAWTVLALAVWMFVLELPALASTTYFLWDWTVSPANALARTLTLGVRLGIPQFMLAIMVWLGFGWCCKKRTQSWLLLSAALFCLIFFANAAGDPTIKHLFAGFWYTDPERTSALVAIAIVPLAAVGLSATAKFVGRTIERMGTRFAWKRLQQGSLWTQAAVIVIVLLVFMPLNYLSSRIPLPLPSCDGVSAFSVTRNALRVESDPANVLIYDADEHAFVDEVREALGDDANALVLNMPYDGSLFAYPEDDLNVYYKSHVYNDLETDGSALIREKLDEIAVDDAVRDAVEATGARYVLKLYQDPASNDDRNKWKPEEWTGFDELTDETPGFEVVLANGDMRLYRITALS